jgi:hypothetical protein
MDWWYVMYDREDVIDIMASSWQLILTLGNNFCIDIFAYIGFNFTNLEVIIVKLMEDITLYLTLDISCLLFLG